MATPSNWSYNASHSSVSIVPGCTGFVVPLSGCDGFGPKRIPLTGATLEGTVTYGNQKVPVALMIAVGANGNSQGIIGDDGRYKIENAPRGEVTLAVNVKAGEGMLMGRRMSGEMNLPNVVHILAKYTDPTTSRLKTTIAKGENTYDIVIPK